MKKIAMVKNNVVVNVSLWDMTTEWNPGKDFRIFDISDSNIGIGDILDGDVFKKVIKQVEYSNDGDIVSSIEKIDNTSILEANKLEILQNLLKKI